MAKLDFPISSDISLDQTQTSRRNFMVAGLGTAVAIGVASGRAAAQSQPDNKASLAPRTNSAPSINDGLAVAIPANPPFGRGKERALVVGGGGEYFAAWMLGYMHALNQSGIDVDQADVVVGTSAGALVGSTVAGGHLKRLTLEFDFFGKFPQLMAEAVPTGKRNDGQLRAREVCQQARTSDLATIQGIGRAAMASRNFQVSKLQHLIGILTANHRWPSPTLHTTGVDCYSGERLVVSEKDDIPVTHAVSASMSVPGTFGPTWLKDRLSMDGGMCSTSTHCDLVAGVKRALVFSLGDGGPGSPRLTNMPNSIQQEITALRGEGTEAMLVVTGVSSKTNLLSPEEVLPAMKDGFAKGQSGAADIKKFWG